MATYDQRTLEALMQSLPELKQKQRRAEELRKVQGQFQELSQKPGAGNYVPTQRGGLYETVARFRPDYAQMANQAGGALGEYLTGRKADEAQGQYDEAQSQALLGGVQQYSQPPTPQAPPPPMQGQQLGSQGLQAPGMMQPGMAPQAPSSPFGPPSDMAPQPPGLGTQPGAMGGLDAAAQEQGATPTQETLRAYLGMIGGPELKDYLPKDKSDDRVQSTFTDDSGEKYLVMASGDVRGTGKHADFGGQITTDETTGKQFITVKTGRFRGQSIPLDRIGDFLSGTATIPGGSEPSAPSAPSPAQVQPLDREGLHARQLSAESNGNPNAVSPVGAQGLMQIMPETAAELEQEMGVPPGSIAADPATNEKAGRLYMDKQLERFGGDQEAALAAYNWGPERAEAWVAAGKDRSQLPEETRGYIEKILGPSGATGASVSPAGAVSGGPRKLTAGEKKFSEEQSKATVEAQTALGKAETNASTGLRAIDDLLKTGSGLETIAGKPGTLLDWGGIPDALAQYAIPFVASGEKEATAYAKWETVKSTAFLDAFESLRGGGQITEAEGNKAEKARAALSRSLPPDELRVQLKNLRDVIEAGLARARARARGDFSGTNALSATIPAGTTSPATAPMLRAPESNPDDDALVNKWLGG